MVDFSLVAMPSGHNCNDYRIVSESDLQLHGFGGELASWKGRSYVRDMQIEQ